MVITPSPVAAEVSKMVKTGGALVAVLMITG
jgi:hypothetical protein